MDGEVRSQKYKSSNFHKHFLYTPFKYYLANLATRAKERKDPEAQKERKKSKQFLEEKLPQITQRYKRRIYNRKIEKKKSLDLRDSYNVLGYVIIILTILWTMTNSFIVYYNYLNNTKDNIENQSEVLDLLSTNLMNGVDNYLNYLGDKILVFNAKHNPEALQKILKKTPNRDLFQRNISSWLTMKFVNTSGKITATTLEGIVKKPYSHHPHYPVERSSSDPWRFKVGKLQHFEDEISKYDYFPVAMSIDTDEKFIPIGTLIADVPTDRIQKNIKRSINNNEICYVIIDKNYDLIAKSDQIKNYDPVLFKNNDKVQEVVNSKIKKSDHLDKSFRIGDCNLFYFQNSDYGISGFAGYDIRNLLQRFSFQLFTIITQSFGVAAMLLLIFFLFRKLKISPFLKELLRAKTEAEKANLTKSQFLSNMSHELRTPMNGILGMSQALRESENVKEDELDQANTIYRCADALLLVLNDILNFSKIEARKIDLENIDFHLSTTINDITDLMAQSATSKGLEVLSIIDNDVPEILNGDPGRIRQIITNLVNNAIKFTSHGQVLIHVKLEKDEEDSCFVNFNIIDSGIGIEKNRIEKMFTRFTQADMSTNRKYGGTGLGLSICKELVELMTGEIGIKSESGKGSNFWFTIPLQKTSGEDSEKDQESEDEINFVKRKKLALIEKNNVVRKVFRHHYMKIGSNLQETEIAPIIMSRDEMTKKLIEEAKKFTKPNVIFVDHNESVGADSVTIVNQLREIKEFKKVAFVVMISPKDKSKMSKESLDIFASYMIKPVRTARIVSCVLSALKFKNKKEGPAKAQSLQEKDVSMKKKEKFKVLLSEDNEVNMRVASMILKRLDLDIETVENGQEAINKFMHVKYDMILMDCMMPVVDGYEATKRIRILEKEGNLTKTPIIALTANATEEDRQKCLEIGMDDFISKPIKREFIEEKIKTWIDKKE